jgi:SAM-dependent methyltransferase
MMKKRKDPVFDLERAYADCHRIALSLANGEPCGRALDLGAGQGALSQALKERGFEVTAADVNAEQFLATGFFDLFVPTKKRLKDPFSSEADGHISPLPGWLLRYFLEDAGFEIEKTRHTMAYIPLVPPQKSAREYSRRRAWRLRASGQCRPSSAQNARPWPLTRVWASSWRMT